MQRGAVLVEMALVLPLLTILFAGIAGFGLVLRSHQILQNAAREGARYSSLPANRIVTATDPAAKTAEIKAYVAQYAQQENIAVPVDGVTINQNYIIDLGGGVTATGSEIIITYPYPASQLIGSSLWPSGVPVLTARSVFRNLY